MRSLDPRCTVTHANTIATKATNRETNESLKNIVQYYDDALSRRILRGSCLDISVILGERGDAEGRMDAAFDAGRKNKTATPKTGPLRERSENERRKKRKNVTDYYLNHLNTQLVETSAGAKERAKFAFLIDPLSEIFPLKPLVESLGNMIVSGIMNNHLEHTTAEYILFLLTTDIEMLVTEGLSTAMHETLVGPLSEMIVDSTSEAMTLQVQRALASSLTAGLSTVITNSVDRDVAERLPSRLGAFVADRLTRFMDRNLLRLLTRSLSLSIVPSLVHAMSHSPLQDYFCYYCYHHGVYCSYCHYAPVQLYYAQYYAEYYAKYYADYFADYASRVNAQEFLNRDQRSDRGWPM
eukprot:g939.t1